MISKKYGTQFDGQYDNRTTEFYGKSSDTKPTNDVTNGSSFVEMDTGDVYLFDEEAGQWLKL